MRTFGMKKQADELIETMNRAAEMAVVEAKPILTNAVKSMSFDDARGILTGGDDAATQYFKRTTSKDIGARFLPIVKTATAKVDLAGQYNKYAGQAAKLGLIERAGRRPRHLRYPESDGRALPDDRRTGKGDPQGSDRHRFEPAEEGVRRTPVNSGQLARHWRRNLYLLRARHCSVLCLGDGCLLRGAAHVRELVPPVIR